MNLFYYNGLRTFKYIICKRSLLYYNRLKGFTNGKNEYTFAMSYNVIRFGVHFYTIGLDLVDTLSINITRKIVAMFDE